MNGSPERFCEPEYAVEQNHLRLARTRRIGKYALRGLCMGAGFVGGFVAPAVFVPLAVAVFAGSYVYRANQKYGEQSYGSWLYRENVAEQLLLAETDVKVGREYPGLAGREIGPVDERFRLGLATKRNEYY
jgi:hypothetical protein